MVPLRPAAERYDVAIMGGGLAGLTLAIQLKRQRPDTSIAVLEKREGPAPLAAFKVGESTVPAGADYFAKVVGMETHLKQRHLVKFGLRFFTPSGTNADISQRGRVRRELLARRRTTFRSIAACSRTSWPLAPARPVSTCFRAAASAKWISGRTRTRFTTPRPKPRPHSRRAG